MKIKFNKLGVSTENYRKKPNFKWVRNITKENIEIKEMVNLIREGYSFTHTFNVSEEYGNKEKTIKNFKQTNHIWFDFDDCVDSMSKVYNKLTYKPNIAYTTISNLKNGNLNRFRLIYILDFNVYSNDNYKYYLNLFLNTIIKDLEYNYLKYIDSNCYNVSQHMFGSNNKSTIITNDNIIYDKDLFSIIEKDYNIKNLIGKNSNCSKKLKSNNIKKEEKILKQNEEITIGATELIDILENFEVKLFKPILSNEDLAMFDDKAIYTNVSEQNIYKINFLYDENDKVRKVKKGYRNKMLFTWGVTIRNIQPNIEIEELFKNIYWLYSFRCEKSEDFTVHQVCNIALNVFKTDINVFNQLGKRKYLIAPNYKELSRADKAKALGQARRKTRDENILPNYDFSKSIKENAKELDVSENTIRSCLKENEILTPKQKNYEHFKEVYAKHPNATIAQLAEWIGVSIKSIVNYKKKLKEQLVENL